MGGLGDTDRAAPCVYDVRACTDRPRAVLCVVCDKAQAVAARPSDVDRRSTRDDELWWA